VKAAPSYRTADVARAAAMVAAVTVAARIVGFGRIIVFAHTVGPTCLGDTYYTANTVPNILFDVVAGGALAGVVVPLLAGRVHDDPDAADRISSALLTWTLLLMVPVLAVGLAAARPIMDLLVGNGHPGCIASREQAVGARMLVVFMPQVMLYAAGIVLTGILQSHRRFFTAALAPLLSSAVVIGAYITFAAVARPGETSLLTLSRGHELILSVGTTAGVVALVLPLLVPLSRTGRRLRPRLRMPDGVARSARRLAIAGAVVLGSQDLATAAILRLANDRGASGAVVLFNLAWTVFLLPWAVLAVPLAIAAFPTLVSRWDAHDRVGFASTASSATRAILLGCAAATAVLIGCAEPAARVVVLGAPGHVAPSDLARALVTFAPGVLAFGVMAHLSRVMYARGDARTPAVATAAGWLVVVVADVALVAALPRTWTAAGLGAGTTIGMTVAAGWMLVALGRGEPSCLRGVGRTLLSGAACAAVAAAVGAALSAALPRQGIAASVWVTAVVAVVTAGVFAGLAARFDRATLLLVLRRRADAR
jgi:putative peptidoglycan lipid II flippase